MWESMTPKTTRRPFWLRRPRSISLPLLPALLLVFAVVAAPLNVVASEPVVVAVQLTLKGTAPAGEQLNLSYGSSLDGSPARFDDKVFCGGHGGYAPQNRPVCKGGGSVYDLAVRVPIGHIFQYEFSRSSTDFPGRSGTILKGSLKVVEKGLQVTGNYSFVTNSGKRGPIELPNRLPPAGGGGSYRPAPSAP